MYTCNRVLPGGTTRSINIHTCRHSMNNAFYEYGRYQRTGKPNLIAAFWRCQQGHAGAQICRGATYGSRFCGSRHVRTNSLSMPGGGRVRFGLLCSLSRRRARRAWRNGRKRVRCICIVSLRSRHFGPCRNFPVVGSFQNLPGTRFVQCIPERRHCYTTLCTLLLSGRQFRNGPAFGYTSPLSATHYAVGRTVQHYLEQWRPCVGIVCSSW